MRSGSMKPKNYIELPQDEHGNRAYTNKWEVDHEAGAVTVEEWKRLVGL